MEGLKGKSSINGGFKGKIIYKWRFLRENHRKMRENLMD
jgi:hypothetical protein